MIEKQPYTQEEVERMFDQMKRMRRFRFGFFQSADFVQPVHSKEVAVEKLGAENLESILYRLDYCADYLNFNLIGDNFEDHGIAEFGRTITGGSGMIQGVFDLMQANFPNKSAAELREAWSTLVPDRKPQMSGRRGMIAQMTKIHGLKFEREVNQRNKFGGSNLTTVRRDAGFIIDLLENRGHDVPLDLIRAYQVADAAFAGRLIRTEYGTLPGINYRNIALLSEKLTVITLHDDLAIHLLAQFTA